jgi:hypothetical protein
MWMAGEVDVGSMRAAGSRHKGGGDMMIDQAEFMLNGNRACHADNVGATTEGAVVDAACPLP